MDAATARIPEDYLDLFTKRSFGHLATLMKDGTPQVTPVWIDFDGQYILVNSRRGRLKNANMTKRAAVAIDIVDPDNPYRYLGIRGQVVEITEEGAEAHLDSLSLRYLGLARYPWYTQGEVRQIFKIQPQHIVTRLIKE